ncbi:33 kDa chaperonin [Gracilariopsis chorda]|uniref:33 kDa chaperonin n=1 Tax=Gracilariopsis chorda TaxID=448386 RepID=A0A2V3IQN2_9FLOR|nr:33 kDa chaperonin [Gracilariopsis chorda]|eukprot:PXF43460.1 33 kDa chaperonin [Gracilariopsis chorda]
MAREVAAAFVVSAALRASSSFVPCSCGGPPRRYHYSPPLHIAHCHAAQPPSPPPSDHPLPFEQLFLKAPVPGDALVRTISANGEVSCSVVSCTGLVSGAARLHRTTPLASTAFGRALACALLMSSGKKDGDSLQIEFRGSGPLKRITTISNALAQVRGYIGNPFVNLPLKNGQFDVPAAIGSGIVAVVKDSVYSKHPYTGMVQISSGQVAQDLAQYLLESEQTPSALGAGVYLDHRGVVTAAGGYLLQLLPGASSETARILENNVRAAPTPTEMVRAGMTPEQIVALLMNDLAPMKLATCSPRYSCRCGVDRVKRTVALIPETEVRQLLADYGRIEATCEFCGQIYSLPPDEVEKILAAQQKP